ncbi:UDP-N-acetylglucosamine 1-carboxyvinyltransferase [Candidatus Peregrinibacteria bacterium]|jgi:UDP-N-acetylglucosamine 1-carboxyvinyltransferase|nr:UDP-N-acetylglucosamine 1-carboxyvinyltransferase [Candidatus Peregrinibacteria bacterium]MBT4147677.1 UDP-N-acetylglucosamine 1-carboxyvinyltransferase [Candidatus Peregrinibacteria bacterium]MBT4365956.1 UDP-N-acetylglucosamine 1-carboxyvinyltransferase [Candidatus Peregrinibacteria bacterium]MBT4455805.1 UDP-N-acetylglucosamine 1-carboxyvinyltransferase [Candidatus Peregrinibacteria bacterium]
MPKFIVQGGHKLEGEVHVSGSKNATLPIMCAALLTDEKTTLTNVPEIADIRSMTEIMEGMGVKTIFKNNSLEIDPSKLKNARPNDDHVCKMRASILLFGPLIANFKKAEMTFPGGCVLGKRSVAAHTGAFQDLGCEVTNGSQDLKIHAKELVGATIIMRERSVTATENAIMAAVKANGTSYIKLAATEPHVQDLCHFLNKMGAKIEGIGSSTLEIEGVKKLKGTNYRITGDYLEAGTFAIAAALTNGNVVIKGIETDHLDSFWQKLREVGVDLELKTNEVHIKGHKKLESVPILKTAVFPSFPTDLQAPFAVLLTQAHGVTKIFETMFEGRLNYLAELERMGAKIELLNPHQAIVIGPSKLKGLPISSYDIRAGAAMVLAALTAQGETEISNINYLDRGYEKLEEKLQSIGAQIQRID